MTLKFIKLQLHNFASYQDSTVDLSDMGFTLVMGRNNCKLDNAYSNGSGKSAIFNGLCFALTGETTQGISSGLENIFTDPDDCWVKLTLQVDSDEFVLQRIKTPKQNLKVFINGEDCSGKGIRESEALLKTYIPDLASELINSIIILGQGMPHRFTNNKPSHRKELLESLTKSDFMIQSIKDSLENRLTDLRLALRTQEDAAVASNSQLGVYQNQLDKFNKELADYNEYSNIDLEIDHLKAKISGIEEEIRVNNELSLKAEADLLKANNDKSGLLSEREQKIKDATSVINLDIQTHTKEQYEVYAEIKSLEREIKKLESITDICPTCGQKIPDINKPSTVEQHAKLDELSLRNSELMDKIKSQQEECNKKSESLKSDYGNKINDLEKSAGELAKLSREYKSKIADLTTAKNRLIEKSFRLQNLKENYNKLLANILETTQNIEDTKTAIQNIKLEETTINSHIDVVQQMITLAKREFRGILLSNVINFIDKKVKQYSKEVFGTDELAFTLNENYIDITYCGKLYENLSGGEKQKIDIIIQLALRDILSKQLNIHSNLLVLDEIYDNADATSCQRITNLISTLTDIDSIFIISHHVNDLGITYDNRLLVEKNEGGISSVSFI